ncbi:hypothetical protein FA10DRAFT_231820 [Acaromyces ingoldii]|uniref:Cytochrome c oxidase assembly factor 3 n=1 Tax=Acaromyces ingoldii TaxID=215250 RepID=A0A316YIA1_9BASI|nr:hypothetical protein FA10DRAFT_231820 [Acaromyces ingoldii]PWN89270.1 hypothetical protein FA10DRAFT_231820 [Acaromyces ingoldii]
MSQPSQAPTRSVVPPRSTHASYHPGGYGVSEGLKRARRPFAVRNAVTGSAIMAFAVGVYWYSISKVKQDDFSDLADVRAAASTSHPQKTTQDQSKRI